MSCNAMGLEAMGYLFVIIFCGFLIVAIIAAAFIALIVLFLGWNGAIGGGVLAFLACCIILIFCCFHQRKDKKAEDNNKIDRDVEASTASTKATKNELKLESQTEPVKPLLDTQSHLPSKPEIHSQIGTDQTQQ